MDVEVDVDAEGPGLSLMFPPVAVDGPDTAVPPAAVDVPAAGPVAEAVVAVFCPPPAAPVASSGSERVSPGCPCPCPWLSCLSWAKSLRRVPGDVPVPAPAPVPPAVWAVGGDPTLGGRPVVSLFAPPAPPPPAPAPIPAAAPAPAPAPPCAPVLCATACCCPCLLYTSPSPRD